MTVLANIESAWFPGQLKRRSRATISETVIYLVHLSGLARWGQVHLLLALHKRFVAIFVQVFALLSSSAAARDAVFIFRDISLKIMAIHRDLVILQRGGCTMEHASHKAHR